MPAATGRDLCNNNAVASMSYGVVACTQTEHLLRERGCPLPHPSLLTLSNGGICSSSQFHPPILVHVLKQALLTPILFRVSRVIPYLVDTIQWSESLTFPTATLLCLLPGWWPRSQSSPKAWEVVYERFLLDIGDTSLALELSR